MPNSSQVDESRILIFAFCSISSLMPWSFNQRQTGSGANVNLITPSSPDDALPPPPPPPPPPSSEQAAIASAAATRRHASSALLNRNIDLSSPRSAQPRSARAASSSPIRAHLALDAQRVDVLERRDAVRHVRRVERRLPRSDLVRLVSARDPEPTAQHVHHLLLGVLVDVGSVPLVPRDPRDLQRLAAVAGVVPAGAADLRGAVESDQAHVLPT